MLPIQLYPTWNQRPSDSNKEINPMKRYFFICEGARTESFYFKKLIDLKKEIGINALIDIVFLDKTGIDSDTSYPINLIQLALKSREKLIQDGEFDAMSDVMVITFDTDIFKRMKKSLTEILELQDKSLMFGLTNPDFELFLLLHIENSVNEIIVPNEVELLNNIKVGNQRPCYKYLLDKTGMNSKHNSNIGNLALNIDVAIEQEKLINQNLIFCLDKVTSNIARIIERIKEDKLPT